MIKIFKTLFNVTPKVGDKVKVAVGFCSYKNKGIVSNVCKDSDGAGYCWINQYSPKGEYLRSFTASFSYCQFHYI